MLGNFFLLNTLNAFNISPILIVILVSVIFVLIYLYKTSEVMNKTFLASMLTAVLIVFIGINIFILLKKRPPKADFRLTFYSLQTESQTVKRNWEGNAFWQMLTQQLQNAVGERAVILSADWTAKIVKSDSANNLQYLSRLNRQIDGEYFLVGLLSSANGVNQVKYQMIDSENNKAVLKGSVEIIPEELPGISWKVSKEILQYFKISLPEKEKNVRLIKLNSYQKFLTAQGLFQKKEYTAALNFAGQSIADDSSMIEANLLAGKSNFMMALKQKKEGKSPVDYFQQSFNWLTKTIELDSLNGEAYSFLGEYYIYRERWSLAEKNLFKAYELNPQNPRLYLSLSRLHDFRYRKLGYKNEEQLFRRAIFFNPCYEDAYLMLSDLYLFENKRQQAIEVLQQILEINPDSVPVLMALGKIYLVRNDILKIIEVFNRVIELEANNSDAYYNLGILYYDSEDYDNAERFLKRAVAIDNHLNSHLYLAYLYEIKGDKEKAIEHLRDRIRYRKGLNDEFAEEARKHLFELMHGDSVKVRENI